MMKMITSNLLLKITVLPLAVFASISAFAAQDVYEYKNNEGVTEFTDQVKDNKKLEKHIQIPKRTAEQEAQSKEKLEDIMKKDKELDKKIAQQRKLENERLRLEEKARADKAKQQSESDNNGNGDWYYPRRPVRPIHRPKPSHPIEGKPSKPGKPSNMPAKPGGRL